MVLHSSSDIDSETFFKNNVRNHNFFFFFFGPVGKKRLPGMLRLNKQDSVTRSCVYVRKVTNGHSVKSQTSVKHDRTVCLHLLIKLIDDALCPLEVQVSDLGGPVDICQLDAHLAHQKSVVLVGPVDPGTVDIVHLKQTGILLSGAQPPTSPA